MPRKTRSNPHALHACGETADVICIQGDNRLVTHPGRAFVDDMLMKWLAGLLLCATPLLALKHGDSREAVIAELGEPQSKMSSGRREVLNYPGGRVMLIDGKVREYHGKFPPASAEPAPANAPPWPPSNRRPQSRWRNQ